MARVDIQLNGRIYPIACDDGQEVRVRQMAAFLERRIAEARQSVRSASDTHLLVMVGLMLADELHEALGQAQEPAGLTTAEADDLAGAIGRLAERVESIAGRLEQH